MANIQENNFSSSQSEESLNESQLVFHRQNQTFSDDCRNIKNISREKCLNACENLMKKTFYKKLLFARLPVLKWLFIEYNLKKDFIHDMIAG